MFGQNQVSDRDLMKAISQRIARTGTASTSKVNVVVRQGNVTLTGTLQYAMQRVPIIKAVSRVAGVRRVTDQMQHVAKKRHDSTESSHAYVGESFVESAKIDDAPADVVVCKPVEEPLPDQPRLE